MALLWADSFDTYGTAAIMASSSLYANAYNSWDPLINNSAPRTGPSAIKINTSNNGDVNVTRILGATPSTMGQIWSLYLTAPTGSSPQTRPSMVWYNAAGTPLISIWPNPAMGLSVSAGDAGGPVLGSTPNNVLQVASYNYIEAKVFGNAVNGSVEIRINANPASLLLTNINTLQAGPGPFAQAGFRKSGGISSGSSESVYADDWAVWDNTGSFKNDFGPITRCRTRFPVTNGPAQAWPVTGAAQAYQALDNVPPLPASQYIQGVNVGDASNFGLTQLPTTTAYAVGINVITMLQASGLGVNGVTPSVISGPTTSDGAQITTNTNAVMYSQIWQNDPNSGGYFLLPALQAMLIQLKRTA